jgi:hypothetical protein
MAGRSCYSSLELTGLRTLKAMNEALGLSSPVSVTSEPVFTQFKEQKGCCFQFRISNTFICSYLVEKTEARSRNKGRVPYTCAAGNGRSLLRMGNRQS